MIARIVIICGDRNWTARKPIRHLMSQLPTGERTVVITGGAKGADTIGHDLAKEWGHRSARIDAPWEFYGKRAGPVRNQWMLDLLLMFKNAYPDAVCDVHAFHANIASSKGTADMIGRTRDAGVPYTLHADVEEGL